MYKCVCPNCKTKAFSYFTKITLGNIKNPFKIDTDLCRNCGQILTIPRWTNILIYPYAFIFIFGSNELIHNNTYMGIVITALIVLYFVLFSLLVPLKKYK